MSCPAETPNVLLRPLNIPTRSWVGKSQAPLDQLIAAFREWHPPLFEEGYKRTHPMLTTNNELLDLVDLLLAERFRLQADAERYRFIVDNARDVTFWASYDAERKNTIGRAEIGEGREYDEVFGSAKAELDSQIDASLGRFS